VGFVKSEGVLHMRFLTLISDNKPHLAQRIVILALAGLLAFYHGSILTDLYIGTGKENHTAFENIQSVLRAVIFLSLLLVMLGVRRALWGMWSGITGLIATQYWAHFGNVSVDFTEGRHALSYLRGFIFPTIITLMSPRHANAN
jgi:hypothetical protein